MTRLTPLLDRNERFARDYTPVPLGLPAAQVVLLTCLDHRVDPALFLGLRVGDAPVIRNAGGRVTPAVVGDLAFLGYLAAQLAGSQLPGSAPGGAPAALFEVAVIHHTQCGTGFLADPGFRDAAAAATGLPASALAASAVADPWETVRADVGRLLAAPLRPAGVSVSGHVYDVATRRLSTVLDARRR
jgi:carbonic anhydrase